MGSTLFIQAVIWVVMATALIVLLLYRKYISKGEVDLIHLREGEAAEISNQESYAHKLHVIDHWGKILGIVLIVYGVLIGAGYLYLAWISTSQPVS